MMLSFCNNKSVHPFLNLASSNMDINGTVLDFSLPHFHHHRRQNIFSTASSGGFACSTDSDLNSAVIPPTGKRDPGGIGFLDEVGGSVDGLMSCTESLGFESSDERSVDDQIEDLDYSHDQFLVSRKSSPILSCCNNNSIRLQKSFEKKEKKKFPPPLTSLNKDGKPNFFLRAVRKDGRLELTEVKIGRPETLLAYRQDGRLRLHLIRNDDEEEEEVETEDQILEDEEEAIETIEEEDEYDEEKDDDGVSEWKFPVTRCGGGGDGFRRCYELGSHHHHGHGHNNHHHDIHVWRQHCVTTS